MSSSPVTPKAVSLFLISCTFLMPVPPQTMQTCVSFAVLPIQPSFEASNFTVSGFSKGAIMSPLSKMPKDVPSFGAALER